MAMAVKCDRCGQYVTEDYYCFDVVKCNLQYSSRSAYSPLDCDLCPDCVEDFKKFMKNDI